MSTRRVLRLNSLLKEVIAEVIRRDVQNRDISPMTTVSQVEITKDLRHAKVYISVIGTPEVKQKTLSALQEAAGYIAVLASKKIVIRYFPELTFRLDDSVEKHMRIDSVLKEIERERASRSEHEESEEE